MSNRSKVIKILSTKENNVNTTDNYSFINNIVQRSSRSQNQSEAKQKGIVSIISKIKSPSPMRVNKNIKHFNPEEKLVTPKAKNTSTDRINAFNSKLFSDDYRMKEESINSGDNSEGNIKNVPKIISIANSNINNQKNIIKLKINLGKISSSTKSRNEYYNTDNNEMIRNDDYATERINSIENFNKENNNIKQFYNTFDVPSYKHKPKIKKQNMFLKQYNRNSSVLFKIFQFLNNSDMNTIFTIGKKMRYLIYKIIHEKAYPTIIKNYKNLTKNYFELLKTKISFFKIKSK